MFVRPGRTGAWPDSARSHLAARLTAADCDQGTHSCAGAAVCQTPPGCGRSAVPVGTPPARAQGRRELTARAAGRTAAGAGQRARHRQPAQRPHISRVPELRAAQLERQPPAAGARAARYALAGPRLDQQAPRAARAPARHPRVLRRGRRAGQLRARRRKVIGACHAAGIAGRRGKRTAQRQRLGCRRCPHARGLRAGTRPRGGLRRRRRPRGRLRCAAPLWR